MDKFEVTDSLDQPSKFGTGIKFGIISGAVYILLLLVRYMFFNSNPMVFTGTIFVSYLIILSFFVQAALARRKELGGYADIKELFSTIFIVVLITEVCYAVFNYIYLNYIDPEFYPHYLQVTLEYMRSKGVGEEVLNHQIDKLQDQMVQMKSISNNLLGLATWLIVDSIIGLIMALVMKKNKVQF